MYSVYKITRDDDGALVCQLSVAEQKGKVSALAAAKRLAGRDAWFDAHYGPSAVAYVGTAATAVVSW